MDKIIEALYYSSISPLCKKPNGKELELMGFLERHRAAVQKGLDADGKVAFEKFEDCYTEFLTEREIEVFKEGFKLGMCFAIEGTDIQTE